MLIPYYYTHFQSLAYPLDEVQINFTASVPVAIDRLRQRHLRGNFAAHPVTILHEGLPVGFFILDFGADRLELSSDPGAVLLRSLSVNPKFQGLGIGSRAMTEIPEYLRKFSPETTKIVLAVNERNPAALGLYKKCGYSFNGKTRMGRSGPQLIMQREI